VRLFEHGLRDAQQATVMRHRKIERFVRRAAHLVQQHRHHAFLLVAQTVVPCP
jgi:hypothetical protein